MRSLPLTFLKGMALGPDTPWRVGTVRLECSGEGKGPGGDSFPKSVRRSRTFQRTHPCLPQAHLPLPSLHSPALVFNIFSCFSCVACIITSCLKPLCGEEGDGQMDRQTDGQATPAVDENLGSGKGQMRAAVIPSLWVVRLWLSPRCYEARFSHLNIGMAATTGSEEG